MTMHPFTATPPAIPARWTASRYNPSTSFGAALSMILKGIVNFLVETQDRAKRRNALASLDDRMLADVGLTRFEADNATKWRIK